MTARSPAGRCRSGCATSGRTRRAISRRSAARGRTWLRLREIAALTAAHEQALAEAYEAQQGSSAWRALAESWDFGDVNDLIERHNRWYPVEARLPMDPRTGDYALVNGERYSKAPLDAAWILQRFPVAASVSAHSAPPSR